MSVVRYEVSPTRLPWLLHSMGRMGPLAQDWQADYSVYVKDSSCFVATTCTGSRGSFEVATLTHFRNTVLRRTPLGRLFVLLYEMGGPALARWVSKGILRRKVVRYCVVRPIAWLLHGHHTWL